MLKISNGVARFEELLLPHGFSTMALGNMAYSWGEESDVYRNAETFYVETGLSRKNRVHMLPQHGTKIVSVGYESAGQAIECDALIARAPDLTLSVLPADCLTIIIKSTAKYCSFVALIHAGWKGTRNGIVSSTMVRLVLNQTLYSGEPFMAYIGPSIGACCYKPSFFSKIAGAKTDLIAENVRQLRDGGMEEEHIIIADTCTFCSTDERENKLFFSHQRAKRAKEQEGRFIAAVAYR